MRTSPETMGPPTAEKAPEEEHKEDGKNFGRQVRQAAEDFLNSIDGVEVLSSNGKSGEDDPADFYLRIQGDYKDIPVCFTAMEDIVGKYGKDWKSERRRELKKVGATEEEIQRKLKEDKEKIERFNEKKSLAKEMKAGLFVHPNCRNIGECYREWQDKQEENPNISSPFVEFLSTEAQKDVLKALMEDMSPARKQQLAGILESYYS